MNTILEHIHLWTTAQTPKTSGRGNRADNQQLLGIQKLRELILELAVRGKLVPQDPNDEPASVLLKKIEAEKKRLIKEGKIKKQEVLPEVGDNEKHFETPRNWEWTRLGNICEIIRGITFSASEKSSIPEEGRVACLRTSNVQDKIEWEDLLFIREVFVKRKDQFIQENDIVMSMANSRELVGKVAIVDKMPSFQTTFGGFLGVLRPIIIDPFYLMLLLREPTNRDSLIDSASQTTNIANISLAKLNPLTLVIPPLPEQHRIVAKVEELMDLCDQLEQQQTENNQLHQTLVETLLANLTQASNLAGQEEAWQRISAHFDVLFTTEYSVDQLKQTILQLAVMGKLVPQNPTDEPASELLKKIAKEKERLVKEGKNLLIEKNRKGEEIKAHYLLPASWNWCRLSDICSQITDGEHITPPRISEGYRLLSAKNVRDGFIDYENCDFISEEIYLKSIKRCHATKGDLLIVSVGGTIGRVSLVVEEIPFALVRSVALIKPMVINSNYLRLVINSPLLQTLIANKSRGGAQPCLYLSEIKNFFFPLAPLAEQHRIVAKVDELFALCDALKERLAQAQATQNLLAGAVVERALVAKPEGKVVYATNEVVNLAAEPE